MIVAGIDGCRDGWVICKRPASGALDVSVIEHKTLADACEGLSILAIDMPTGFVDQPKPPRACEGEARKRLPGKTSSVFPTPCRPVLACTSYAEANALSRSLGIGLPKQTFYLFKKMREVDDLLQARPDLQAIVHEAHPELAFAEMNGGVPVLSKKRRREGYVERRRLLEAAGFPCPVERLKGAARDDILDAIAMCWTALRIAEGTACRLGSPDARDSAGLPMTIWY